MLEAPRPSSYPTLKDAAITRSGFVALIGKPNVGKSTFLNRALGEKIVITSPKPQTTRNRVTGVVNRRGTQLVFFDTPGVHRGEKLINRYMKREALSCLEEVDAVVFLVDSGHTPDEDDLLLAGLLTERGGPVLLGINKVDLGGRYAQAYERLGKFHSVHTLSALSGKGVVGLLDELATMMPEGPEYYPEDFITDRPERFIAQEYIREKVFTSTGEELPYSVAVTVDKWEEKPGKDLVVIYATIHVERPSQKAIIIGKGGQLIKKIGARARKDLQSLLGMRVFLDLHVGVEKNWTKDPRQLARFGYGEDR